MNIYLSVKHIYPDLTDSDFRVEDTWKWPELHWLIISIPRPTEEELQTAWLEVEKQLQLEEAKKQKSLDINAIVTLTDQLNLLWASVYKLSEWTTDPDLLKARKVYEDIQAILTK